jgi:hypothetical protein
MSYHVVPTTNTGPYVPSDVERKYYFYGLPTMSPLVARSGSDVWMPPTGPEAYLDPKELAPLGKHRLDAVFDDIVGPAMVSYLQNKQVQCNSIHPLRIGFAGQASPPAVMLVGVDPDSLSPELGIEIALHCRSILLSNDIDDMHVEIRESKVTSAASLYKPAISANPAAVLREPFSTSLGIPISPAKTPWVEGTGAFIFIDNNRPGIPLLLTARHVLFNPDEEKNELYVFREGTGQPRRHVMLLGTDAFMTRVNEIEASIGAKNLIVKQLNSRLKAADEMEDEEDAEAEREAVASKMAEAETAITAFNKLLADVKRDWQDEKTRIIGHVLYSPPIRLSDGEDGFTEDWAVVQLDPKMISKLNFIGNLIDVGSVAVDDLTSWMYPNPANPHSFEYPGDRFHKCVGMVSDQEMYKPDPSTQDQDNDPTIMVLMNGNTSRLSVGRLNTIRPFVRTYFKGVPGAMSREIAVLPRNSKSGPFSKRGDSGSGVVDAKGRFCGVLTGGDGTSDLSDITFITSINFIVKRLQQCGFRPNLFPTKADL